jgi:TolA-binding protein
VTDAWYERTRPVGARGATAPGNDSLAQAVIEAGDKLLARFPEHARGADIVWRQSQLGLAHGWRERAVRDLARMTARYPDDARAPVAASQRGDALYRLGDFEAAGAAFEEALAAARRAGRDSLARVAARAIPVCYYRHAESAAAADSNAHERNAERFEQFATRWPEYEHAHVALYRAGLAYARAGRQRDAVRAMQTLLQRFPGSEYVRDARLQIAKSWEALGEREQAALAYVEFAQRHPDDESAGPAYLKAGDLAEAAGRADQADSLRLTYIRKFPGDVETAMTLLEAMSLRELDRLGPGQPISTLLGRTGAPRRGAHPAPAPASHLADYLRRAAAHPALASRDLVARVRFLQGEEAYAAYGAKPLAQPLTTSIPAKKRLLDTLLVRYRRTVDLGVPEWAHAAAFRIGMSLVEFGEALEHSERPADLRGDDLRAYENVLGDQSRTFSERGQAVWTDLVRREVAKGSGDTWTAQAQSALWQRLSSRFLYRPEAEFPLVRATPPAPVREESRRAEGTKASLRDGPRPARALARRERPE